MKACIIQPPYSANASDGDAFFQFKMKMLDQCDESVDLIVLPEYSDVPYATTTREETLACHDKYLEPLLARCKQTAQRCGALVFVNALSEEAGQYRNTTYVLNQHGGRSAPITSAICRRLSARCWRWTRRSQTGTPRPMCWRLTASATGF